MEENENIQNVFERALMLAFELKSNELSLPILLLACVYQYEPVKLAFERSNVSILQLKKTIIKKVKKSNKNKNNLRFYLNDLKPSKCVGELIQNEIFEQTDSILELALIIIEQNSSLMNRIFLELEINKNILAGELEDLLEKQPKMFKVLYKTTKIFNALSIIFKYERLPTKVKNNLVSKYFIEQDFIEILNRCSNKKKSSRFFSTQFLIEVLKLKKNSSSKYFLKKYNVTVQLLERAILDSKDKEIDSNKTMIDSNKTIDELLQQTISMALLDQHEIDLNYFVLVILSNFNNHASVFLLQKGVHIQKFIFELYESIMD